jgi:hypothetical protein
MQQVPESKNPSKKTPLLNGCLVVVAIAVCLWAFAGCLHPYRKGDVVITAGTDDDFLTLVSPTRALAQKSEGRYKKFAPGSFFVQDDCRAKVLDVSGGLPWYSFTEIELLTGDEAGRSGWVLTNQLRALGTAHR